MHLGFLREYTDDIVTLDNKTGLVTTGLNYYLNILFPYQSSGWIHDERVSNKTRLRPDYRNEELKLVVEFDGLPHYQNPDIIKHDLDAHSKYKELGYKLVRIPYFIQITDESAGMLFKDFKITPLFELFDSTTPSFDVKLRNTPAYMCVQGILRMRKEFTRFPKSAHANITYMENNKDDLRSGYQEFKTCI